MDQFSDWGVEFFRKVKNYLALFVNPWTIPVDSGSSGAKVCAKTGSETGGKHMF